MFTELSREPRAMRQVRAFAEDFEVTTAGIGASPFPTVPHIEIPAEVPGPFLRRAWRFAWRTLFWRMRSYTSYSRLQPHAQWVYNRLQREEWDVIIAHDVQTVPVANRLNSRNGVLVDLHEYAPRQYEHSEEWVRETAPYYDWICSTQITQAARVITVGEGIAHEYEKNYGFSPEVIVNATPYTEHNALDLHTPIRLVHSGIAAPARKLEIMVQGLRATELPMTLDLLLVHPEGSDYLEELRRLADGDSRIRILPAVPYAQLVQTLNQYDIGISIIAPTTFNHEWSLPNKFFDYVQARLGIIIGPSPEMSRYVDQYGLGVCARGFAAEDFAEILEGLTVEDVLKWKRNAAEHAAELSGERQMQRLGEIVRGMLPDSRQMAGR